VLDNRRLIGRLADTADDVAAGSYGGPAKDGMAIRACLSGIDVDAAQNLLERRLAFEDREQSAVEDWPHASSIAARSIAAWSARAKISRSISALGTSSSPIASRPRKPVPRHSGHPTAR